MPAPASPSGPTLGLSLAPSSSISVPQLIELVRLADSLGFHSFWLPETWGADASALLGTLAAETRHIKLASGVFNVYSRSAALISQAAATLQTLSAGRFLLGLGASGPRVIEHWHGIAYQLPVRRTREYIEVIRLALSGERVDYEGEIVRVRDFRLTLLPPHPVPIYVAALGPQNVRMTGEVADGWLPIFAARGHMGALRAALEAGAASAGRDPNAISVAAFIPYMTGERAERLLRQQIAHYVGGMGTFYAEFVSRLGFERDAADIRRRWESGDRVSAVKAVSPDLLDLCTLGARPDDAWARADEYLHEGVDIPVAALPVGCTPFEAEAAVRSLAGRASSPRAEMSAS